MIYVMDHQPEVALKYKSYAKEIKGFIDSKVGIIINDVDNDEYLDNNENIDEL
jgi:hypothetical protein